MATQKKDATGIIIGALIAGFLVATIAFILPGIRHEQVHQSCRLRLRRLGDAVTRWVEDHGREIMPQVRNPIPATPWQPDRVGSAAVLLGPYLRGDVPRVQREGEEREAWLARMRETELTVCPVSQFEYWYNPELLTTDPRRIADGSLPAQMVFSCQLLDRRQAPHEQDGHGGIHVLYANGIQRQVTEEELAELEQVVRQRVADFPDDPLVHRQKALLAEYQAGLVAAKADPTTGGVLVVNRVAAEDVRFEPAQ